MKGSYSSKNQMTSDFFESIWWKDLSYAMAPFICCNVAIWYHFSFFWSFLLSTFFVQHIFSVWITCFKSVFFRLKRILPRGVRDHRSMKCQGYLSWTGTRSHDKWQVMSNSSQTWLGMCVGKKTTDVFHMSLATTPQHQSQHPHSDFDFACSCGHVLKCFGCARFCHCIHCTMWRCSLEQKQQLFFVNSYNIHLVSICLRMLYKGKNMKKQHLPRVVLYFLSAYGQGRHFSWEYLG